VQKARGGEVILGAEETNNFRPKTVIGPEKQPTVTANTNRQLATVQRKLDGEGAALDKEARPMVGRSSGRLMKKK